MSGLTEFAFSTDRQLAAMDVDQVYPGFAKACLEVGREPRAICVWFARLTLEHEHSVFPLRPASQPQVGRRCT